MGLGCAGEASAPENAGNEDVGTYTSAFTNGYWTYTWYGPKDVDTGLNPSSWTCFLAGAGEWLTSGDGSGNPGYAGAYINNSTNTWHFLSRYPFSNLTSYGPGASIMCVPAPRTGWAQYYHTYTTSSGRQYLAPVSDTNRICALVAVYNDSATDEAWTQNGATGVGSGDSAYITSDGVNYYLDGTGNAEAIATCFDHTAGGYHGHFGCYGNTSCPMITGNINTYQCVIDGLGGQFDWTYPNINPSNGAWIRYNSSTTQWTAEVDNGKALTTRCFE
jgi:hypothetical protein